jgi:hypothetical protein
MGIGCGPQSKPPRILRGIWLEGEASKAQTLGTALPEGHSCLSGILGPSAAGIHEEP